MRKTLIVACMAAFAVTANAAAYVTPGGNSGGDGPCAGQGGVFQSYSYQGVEGSHWYLYQGIVCNNGDTVDDSRTYLGEYD